MNPERLLKNIQADLKVSPVGRVLYLEGQTDTDVLQGLLGPGRRVEPTSEGHPVVDGVLVKGFRRDKGGRRSVEQHLQAASSASFAGVYGVIDGDGREPSDLPPAIGAEPGAALASWPCYCVENLLAQVPGAWPRELGDEPDWAQVFSKYAPYAAINRLVEALKAELVTLDLMKHSRPTSGQPLLSAEEVLGRFGAHADLVSQGALERRYREGLELIQEAIEQGPTQGHRVINGKWFITHLAQERSGLSQERIREAWTASVGRLGHPEVIAWWETSVRPSE